MGVSANKKSHFIEVTFLSSVYVSYRLLTQTPVVKGAVLAPAALGFCETIASMFVVFPEMPFLVNAVKKLILALFTFNELS
jgi:hypothetical protein